MQEETQNFNVKGFQKVATRNIYSKNQPVQWEANDIPTENKHSTFSNLDENIKLPRYLMNLDLNVEETQAKSSQKRNSKSFHTKYQIRKRHPWQML